jgi:hypothetical protein
MTLLPPLAAQMIETRWVAATMARLWDDDTNTVAAAVRAFDNHPLRFGRFADDVCEQVVIGRAGILETNKLLDSELVRMLGPNVFEDCQPRDPHG